MAKVNPGDLLNNKDSTDRKDCPGTLLAENPYNSNFIWNENDPWLGVNVDYNFVELTRPLSKISESEKNVGFYWLYPSPKKENPVLLTLITNGYCVQTKAFGRINPLDIDKENRCLKKKHSEQFNRKIPFIVCRITCWQRIFSFDK